MPPSALSSGAEVLTLEQYLMQVRENHQGIQALTEAVLAGEKRAQESQLVYAPTLYADARVISDAKMQPLNFILFKAIDTYTFSLGVSKTTAFGLSGKLHYDWYQSFYVGFNGAAFGISSIPTYYNASPVLEFTQNLWSNWAGRSTLASSEQMAASAQAAQWGSSFQVKVVLTQAELAYWNLGLARRVLAIHQASLERAKLIHQWNLKREQRHLGELSDSLQSEAQLQQSALSLLSAEKALKKTAHAFNALRSQDAWQVAETLTQWSAAHLAQLAPPLRGSVREDLKAAEQQMLVSEAQARLGLERNKPSLDLSVLFALNGQGALAQYSSIPMNFQEAMQYSLGWNRPTVNVALHFSMPLDLHSVQQALHGWSLEKTAAEKTLDRKRFEQEQDWLDLMNRYEEFHARIQLSLSLENIQEKKLQAERQKLQQGRSTTYQVLFFEQDYLMAQLTSAQDEASLLGVVAEMKQYGEAL